MQLAGWTQAFAEIDLGVAAMTYDPLEILAGFHAEHALGYPLLHDQDAVHVTAFGVLNTDYGPDEDNYGIPYPGIVWIGADGRVRGTWAVPGYRTRPPFEEVMGDIQAELNGDVTD